VEFVRKARHDLGAAVKFTGVINPRVRGQVDVGFIGSDVVAHLDVRIGNRVQKEEPLAELDSCKLVTLRASLCFNTMG
jgi:multidrug efflux pump subunit AcrA (membrane-fusion protein)